MTTRPRTLSPIVPRCLAGIAAVLPFLTLLLPVYVLRDGSRDFGPSHPPLMFVVALAIGVMAVSLPLRPAPTRWMFLALLLAWLLIGAMLAHLLDPPTVMWDGYDPIADRFIGGMATIQLGGGQWLVAASFGCLVIAGLIARRVRPAR